MVHRPEPLQGYSTAGAAKERPKSNPSGLGC